MKYKIPVFLSTAADPDEVVVQVPAKTLRAPQLDRDAEIRAMNEVIREHIALRAQMRADMRQLNLRLAELRKLEAEETRVIAQLQKERAPMYQRRAYHRKQPKEK